MSNRLIHDQIEYYRRRAPEYDRTSTPIGDPFEADAERIRAQLRALRPGGRVLELACGTGQWTGLLAEFSDELTAVDASPEMLRLNTEKVGDPRIRYLTADLFAFAPDGHYDTSSSASGCRTCPPDALPTSGRSSGRVWRPRGGSSSSTRRPHGLWDEDWVDRDSGVVRRRLLDGSMHRIVKALWAPPELQALTSLGWEVSVQSVGPFYWGQGRPTAA